MHAKIEEKNGVTFVEGVQGGTFIKNEKDALDIAGICGDNGTSRVLLHSENLSDDFFDLKTGVAGGVLQKFINYRIHAAAVIPVERIGKGRFFEMVVESNRGRDFRVFQDRDKAVEWLVSLAL
jgi:hypothetical protein